jgi:hypothetical protein
MALTDNLLAYWKLDESSGNASDSTASGLTLTNNNTATYSAGKINNGVNLNGSNQSLRRAPTITGLPNTVFTLAGWFKLNNTTDCVMACFGLDGSNTGAALQLSGSKFTTEFQIGSGTGKVQGSVISTGVWYHVAFVCDGSNVTLYVDGSSAGSVSRGSGQANSSGAIILGAWVSSGGAVNGNFMNGSIDEIGLWTRALSGAEISQLYSSGSGRTYPFDLSFSIAEALAMTETFTSLRTRLFTTSESLSLTETVTALKGLIFTVSETLGLTEFLTTSRSLIVSVAESLGIVEVMARVKALWTQVDKESTDWTSSDKNDTNWTNINKS